MTGDIREHYTDFKNGVDVITSTVGSILSCNIITPILRNQYAANKQKEILAKKDLQKNITPNTNLYPLKTLSMDNYQRNAYAKFSGGNLRI